MKAALPLLFAITAAASASCLPVTGDHITGQDLAAANPQFSPLPATLQLAFTPAPGKSRIFDPVELQRLARANGIALTSAAEVCFEMTVHAPAETEFMEAMRRSLPASTGLKMVEMGHAAIPAGQIEFPLSSLAPPAGSDGARLWRGFVQYTGTRRLAVWARVAVVEDPPVARRGDTVSVEVHSGSAVLHFDAIAQNTVREGGIADLRNPSTGRIFHARIDGSKAILIVGKGPA